ncbi:GNAT family N-acetyltransferase [Parapedobacter tibetensis]|uniref:GNAT family N-acetyltransferase n=1 Tax=Parapedobacter tibetensis TaxID=2972951 RepID=UPI00214D8958|nr:GNAT family N-acetyltransferase [Parapedobacter tibetensis]
MALFINRIKPSGNIAEKDSIGKTAVLSNSKVVLNVLTYADAEPFFRLYSNPELYDADECPIQSGDTPESFSLRIVARCEMVWTIRLATCPDAIIGDCALHHWDSENAEIEFGGSLLPEFWGQGIMPSAFQSVIAFAKEEYGVKSVVSHTLTGNQKAIRFANKMGFKQVTVSDGHIHWVKIV